MKAVRRELRGNRHGSTDGERKEIRTKMSDPHFSLAPSVSNVKVMADCKCAKQQSGGFDEWHAKRILSKAHMRDTSSRHAVQ